MRWSEYCSFGEWCTDVSLSILVGLSNTATPNKDEIESLGRFTNQMQQVKALVRAENGTHKAFVKHLLCMSERTKTITVRQLIKYCVQIDLKSKMETQDVLDSITEVLKARSENRLHELAKSEIGKVETTLTVLERLADMCLGKSQDLSPFLSAV